MQPQLFEVEISNQVAFDKAEKEYNDLSKKEYLKPVHLVANVETKEYFVTRFFSEQHIKSYKNFLIIK